MEPYFSEWTTWDNRNNVEGVLNSGIYLIAIFIKKPKYIEKVKRYYILAKL
jgi:hypothetical protein